MNLFQSGEFALHAGGTSSFRIECDALTPEDWRTLAMLVAMRESKFGSVLGVPSGGERFAVPLRSYATDDPNDPRLVVDDVWTTGSSILAVMRTGDIGWVAFARHPIPERLGVRALFTLDDGRS